MRREKWTNALVVKDKEKNGKWRSVSGDILQKNVPIWRKSSRCPHARNVYYSISGYRVNSLLLRAIRANCSLLSRWGAGRLMSTFLRDYRKTRLARSSMTIPNRILGHALTRYTITYYHVCRSFRVTVRTSAIDLDKTFALTARDTRFIRTPLTVAFYYQPITVNNPWNIYLN